MPESTATPTSRGAAPATTTRRAAPLLLCGVVAGPFYLVVGLLQAFTRQGFDIRRHDLSLLSDGDLGWIQIANFAITGLLVIAAAIGLRRSLAVGRGRTWGPILIGLYGVGLLGAAVFVADPAFGFPPGTPADAHAISTSGLMHFAFGGIGFLAFIAGCFVFARRFAAERDRGWATFSIITGVVFLAGFVGIASGSGGGATLLGFWLGLVVAWTWLSGVSVRQLSGGSRRSIV